MQKIQESHYMWGKFDLGIFKDELKKNGVISYAGEGYTVYVVDLEMLKTKAADGKMTKAQLDFMREYKRRQKDGLPPVEGNAVKYGAAQSRYMICLHYDTGFYRIGGVSTIQDVGDTFDYVKGCGNDLSKKVAEIKKSRRPKRESVNMSTLDMILEGVPARNVMLTEWKKPPRKGSDDLPHIAYMFSDYHDFSDRNRSLTLTRVSKEVQEAIKEGGFHNHISYVPIFGMRFAETIGLDNGKRTFVFEDDCIMEFENKIYLWAREEIMDIGKEGNLVGLLLQKDWNNLSSFRRKGVPDDVALDKWLQRRMYRFILRG